MFRYGFSLVDNEQKIVKKLCGFYFGKIFKWFFILEKLSSGYLIWKKNYVVFSFGTNDILLF
jgi:hypothetical protein